MSKVLKTNQPTFLFTGLKVLSVLFFVSIFFSSNLIGQVTKTASTGNWNSSATWSPAGVPAADDPVIIPNGVTLTGNLSTTCASITFTGASATLSVNSGITLIVTGAITLNTAVNNASACTISGQGSINCGSITVGTNVSVSGDFDPTMTSTIANLTITGNGDLTLFAKASGSNYSNANFNLNSGILTIPGQIVPSNIQNNPSNGVRFRMTLGAQNGTLILNNQQPWASCANCTGSGRGFVTTLLNGTSSTVIYNRTNVQTVLPTTYTNLTLAGDGIKTTSSVTVNGRLSMQGTASVGNPIVLGPTSTLEYKGSVAQTTSANEFPSGASGPLNLIIDNPLGVALHAPRTLRISATNTNTVRLVRGTLDNTTNNLTISTGSTIIRSGGSIAAVPVFGANVNISYTQHTASITCGPELPTNLTSLNNLTINNTNGVVLDRNARVNGSITMTNGVLTIEPADTLYIFSGNQISGTFGSATHIFTKTDPITGAVGYIRSKVSGVNTFPLGDGTYYLPATLRLTSVGLNEFNLALFRPATRNGEPNGTIFPDLSPLVNAVWLINRLDGTTSTDISLAWNGLLEGSEFQLASNEQIGISRYDGANWDPIVGIDGDNDLNLITRPDVNDFSPFIVTIIGTPLPLKFGNISASRNGQSVNVKWQALSEDNVAYYEVQRSNTGASFSKSGVVNAVAQNFSSYKYAWIDATPGNGTLFYRIKAVDNDGKFQYSSIVKVASENGNRGLNIYPNPVQANGRFNIEAGSLPRGTYTIELIDMNGTRSFTRLLEHAGGSLTQNMELSKSLKPGTYVMKLSGENVSYTSMVIINQ